MSPDDLRKRKRIVDLIFARWDENRAVEMSVPNARSNAAWNAAEESVTPVGSMPENSMTLMTSENQALSERAEVPPVVLKGAFLNAILTVVSLLHLPRRSRLRGGHRGNWGYRKY
jgi:hypothetical protein